MNMKQFNICEAFRGLDDIDDSIVTEVIKTEKPTVVFTCNVKTLNEGLELKEAFSPSMPDWLKKRLKQDRGTKNKLTGFSYNRTDYADRIKLSLGNSSRYIDLSNAQFIEAPVPTSAKDKVFKNDAYFFFLLKSEERTQDKRIGEQVYIKDLDDDEDFVLARKYYNNEWKTVSFRYTSMKTILEFTTKFCYVLKDKANTTDKLQYDRATGRQGDPLGNRDPYMGAILGKEGKYYSRDREPVFMNGPQAGKKATYHTVQPGEKIGVKHSSGFDSSGFPLVDLAAVLAKQKGEKPYETLKKLYDKLDDLRKLISKAYDRIDLDNDNYTVDSAYSDLVAKATGNSYLRSGEEILAAFSERFRKLVSTYRELLNKVNEVTENTRGYYNTPEEKERGYRDVFTRYLKDFSTFGEFNKAISLMKTALDKFHKYFIKDVSMDEFEVEEKLEKKELKEALAVDLRDEKAIEEGKEFKDKSDDAEVIETVIDLDAEDENELKSKSHAGDLLFKCTTCGKDIYRSVEDFQVAEKQDDGTYKLKSLDNREEFLSCPECQNQFFRLDGKVTPMAEVGVEAPAEEDKGAEMDWDLGDVSDEEAPVEEPAAEEAPVEEAPVEDIGNIEVDLPEENFEEDLELPEEDFEEEEEDEEEEKEELHDSLDLGREIEHYLKENYEGIEGFKVTNITESLVEGTLIMANPYSEEAVTFNYKTDKLFEGITDYEVSGEVLDESFTITERK